MTHAPASSSFVLGLDGIPWNLIDRWIAAGDLPNFERLTQLGAYGPLESTIPPTTAVAWPSIATGVRADKHGIYGFRRLTPDYRREVNTSAAIEHPTLWDVSSPAVVVNVPMTYPATPIDGTMITGMMTPNRSNGFTHPPEVAEEIETTVPDYEIGLAWHEYQDRETDFVDELTAMVDARRRLMDHLLETREWSLFFFVYTAPDRLQHLIWDESVIRSHYTQLDQIVGDVLDRIADTDTNLFIVSDHGFGPVHDHVHINTILESEGYLKRKGTAGSRGIFESAGITKTAIRSMLQRTGVEQTLLRTLPDSLVEDVARRIPGDHTVYDVDFTETLAFGFSTRNLYVNDSGRFVDGPVSPTDRPTVKHELKTILEDLKHPNSNAQLFRVFDGSELFPTDPLAPDLVLEASTGSEIHTALASEIVEPTTTRSGGHRSTGIFFATGPNIEPGRVSDATVFDIAPTVLHSQLDAIPRDVDGRVLEIFRSHSPPATEAPTYAEYRSRPGASPTDQDYAVVEDRLRGLGYIE